MSDPRDCPHGVQFTKRMHLCPHCMGLNTVTFTREGNAVVVHGLHDEAIDDALEEAAKAVDRSPEGALCTRRFFTANGVEMVEEIRIGAEMAKLIRALKRKSP